MSHQFSIVNAFPFFYTNTHSHNLCFIFCFKEQDKVWFFKLHSKSLIISRVYLIVKARVTHYTMVSSRVKFIPRNWIIPTVVHPAAVLVVNNQQHSTGLGSSRIWSKRFTCFKSFLKKKKWTFSAGASNISIKWILPALHPVRKLIRKYVRQTCH